MTRHHLLGAVCGVLGFADLVLLNVWLAPRAWPERVDPARPPSRSRLVASPPDARVAPAPIARVARDARNADTSPTAARPARLIVRFGSSSSLVSPAEAEAIRAVARELRRERRPQILVDGHTDRRGETDLNQRLSWLRAQAVAAILIAEGIPASWLTTRGLGTTRPLDAADTPASWESNRRVEVRVGTEAAR